MVASIMTLPHCCLREVVAVNCFRPVSSADENGFVAAVARWRGGVQMMARSERFELPTLGIEIRFTIS